MLIQQLLLVSEVTFSYDSLSHERCHYDCLCDVLDPTEREEHTMALSESVLCCVCSLDVPFSSALCFSMWRIF